MRDLGLYAVLGLVGLLAAKQRQDHHALSLAQMVELARTVGFSDPELAAAIAEAESGGRAWVVTPEPHGSPSYGLWQIHLSDHPEFQGANLLDPFVNARAALLISQGGIDWHLWSTYTSGDYKRWYNRPTS